MTTEWVITAAAEHVGLNATNQGEITFTVTNPGTTQDRVVFELVAGDGAASAWFSVEEPQRLVAGGASVSYLVRIAAPAGVAAGAYWLQGRAYSADTAPEEGSRLSQRVAFEVAAQAVPAKRPWWPYAVVAGLLVLVLAVVGWLVFRDDEKPTAQPSPTATAPSPTPAPLPTPIRTGELTIPQTWTVDFDNGIVGSSPSTDIWFNAQTATIRHVVVQHSAVRMAYLGTGAGTDPRVCTRASLGTAPIPFLSLNVGGLLCVQTSEGRMAVVTIIGRTDPSPGQLVVRYALYTGL